MSYANAGMRTVVCCIFIFTVFKVWRLLSQKKYLRANECTMIIKVTLMLLEIISVVVFTILMAHTVSDIDDSDILHSDLVITGTLLV